jgi:hypothetical protein
MTFSITIDGGKGLLLHSRLVSVLQLLSAELFILRHRDLEWIYVKGVKLPSIIWV